MKQLIQRGMILTLVLGAGLVANVAAAAGALTLNSFTLNGGSSITVAPGASILLSVTATPHDSSAGSDWEATSWRISTTTGSGTCASQPTPNYAGTAASTTQFNITAPLVDGTYNVYVQTFHSASCTSGDGNKSAIVSTTGSVVVVTDTTPPSVSAAHIASNNANTARAKVGDTVTLTFTASEAVRTPVVTIAGHSVSAATTTGNSFTASYVMTSGDAEGTVPFSVTLTDTSGNPASAVTATTDASSVTFDKTAPILGVVTAVPTPGNDATPPFSFSSTEAGTFSYAGSCTGATTAATTGTNDISFSTLSDGTYSDCTVTVTDATGNASSALNVPTFVVDTTAPTVTLADGASSSVNSSVLPITVTATFSESVSDFTSDDVTLVNATLSNFAGSGTTYTFDVTPSAEGSFTVDIATNIAHDAAGNGNTAATQDAHTYDNTKPAVEITAPTDGSKTNATNVTMTYSTSEGTDV